MITLNSFGRITLLTLTLASSPAWPQQNNLCSKFDSHNNAFVDWAYERDFAKLLESKVIEDEKFLNYFIEEKADLDKMPLKERRNKVKEDLVNLIDNLYQSAVTQLEEDRNKTKGAAEALHKYYQEKFEAEISKTADELGKKLTFSSPLARANIERTLRSGISTSTGASGIKVVGSNARLNVELREVVAIVSKLKGQPFNLCTGTLVSDKTVLTAGHCICSMDLQKKSSREKAFIVTGRAAGRSYQNLPEKPVGPFVVGPGSIQLGKEAPVAYELDENIEPKLLNEDFCSNQNRYAANGEDLALIYTKNPISKPKLAEFVHMEMLKTKSISSMFVAGFGISDFIQGPDKECYPKVGVDVPIASRFCGRPGDAARYNCSPGREVVLIDWHRFDSDTCNGDSGGPAFVKYWDRFYLAAVTSRAVSGDDCGKGGIYTLLRSGIQFWIRKYLISSTTITR